MKFPAGPIASTVRAGSRTHFDGVRARLRCIVQADFCAKPKLWNRIVDFLLVTPLVTIRIAYAARLLTFALADFKVRQFKAWWGQIFGDVICSEGESVWAKNAVKQECVRVIDQHCDSVGSAGC